MNNWGIPQDVEDKVKARDKQCVYCHISFDSTTKNRATWEHIDNERWDDMSIVQVNIALCCGACNASKGARDIRVWLKSNYCQRKGISESTVAECIREFLKLFPQSS